MAFGQPAASATVCSAQPLVRCKCPTSPSSSRYCCRVLPSLFCAPFCISTKTRIYKMIKAFWSQFGKTSQSGWNAKKKRLFPVCEDCPCRLEGSRKMVILQLFLPLTSLCSSRKILFPPWRTLLFQTCLGKKRGRMGQAPLPAIRISPSGE